METAKKQFTEKDLPICLGTFDNLLELNIRAQANRGVTGLKVVTKCLREAGITPTERIIRSIGGSGTLQIISTLWREQAEVEAAEITNKFVKAGTLKVAQDEANEIIKKLQETDILTYASTKWLGAVLDYIDYSTMSVTEEQIIEPQAWLYSVVIRTVEGLAMYNEHLAILDQLNKFSSRLPEGKAAGCVYDANIGFKPTSIDYDTAALKK